MLLTSNLRKDYLNFLHLTVHSAFKCFKSSPDGLKPQWQVSAGCQGFRVDKPKAREGRWVVLCLNLTETAYMKCYLLHTHGLKLKLKSAPVSTDSDLFSLHREKIYYSIKTNIYLVLLRKYAEKNSINTKTECDKECCVTRTCSLKHVTLRKHTCCQSLFFQ